MSFNECWEPREQWQQGLENIKFRVKTTNQLVHQSPIKCITISEGVDTLLQYVAVVVRRHLALDKIVEFTLHMSAARLISYRDSQDAPKSDGQ
jgi:hypothetical protein